jgi:DNA modification methylase
MIHIHPFPARMAPEIALNRLQNLPQDCVILDPMSGSGMVLGTAAKLGLFAFGYDLDPLACMISRVNGTELNEQNVRYACNKLLTLCHTVDPEDIRLDWIDQDSETRDFIDFWFAPKQRGQLRALSHLLVAQPFLANARILDVLKIAVSRLIVTKEPKASLARDTAHSRPHKTITDNNFDVFEALPSSLEHVLKALNPGCIKTNAKVYRGDARRMGRIRDGSVDCIVTSPPYLNAIDYMRGHRLSLVWWGFGMSPLRRIRARSVGTEIAHPKVAVELDSFFRELHFSIDNRQRNILRRYYYDLREITHEAFRVLRGGGTATYIIGDSRIKGHDIKNSTLLIQAAEECGFRLEGQFIRDIPENKRYMPMVRSGTSNLSKRMRSEHVITFAKH